jgi:hypothetical protein
MAGSSRPNRTPPSVSDSLAEPVKIVGDWVSASTTINLWWMCTAGGECFFLPVFLDGVSVDRLLKSTLLSSGRKSAGALGGADKNLDYQEVVHVLIRR